jgi:hypothetical protein
MAIFQDEAELQRQDQRVQFRGMKGANRRIASVLGYNAQGGRNKWGKALNVITPYAMMANPLLATGLSVGGRIASKQLSKGTDANTVMDETDDEFLRKTAQDVGSAMQLHSSAYKMGEAAGGIEGDVNSLGSAGGAALGTGTDDVVSGDAGQKLAALTESSKRANIQDAIQADVDGVDIDALTAEEEDWLNEEDDDLEDVSGLVKSVEAKNAKEKVENERTSDDTTKDLVKMLGEGGKMIEAGTKSYYANKEYSDAGDEEAMKLLKRTRRSTKNYL